VTPSATPHEVALLRLAAQRLAGPPCPTPLDAVRLLTAAQAQDHPGALCSVALRTAARSRAGVEAALDAGEVVRSWPMRGTLHLVAADDLHWMLELLGPRALAGLAGRRAALGLTEADAERARELAVAALAGGKRLRREALLAAIADGGVPTTGQRGYHLLWFLAQTGTLCLGPTEQGQQLFVLLDEWVPAPRRVERERALTGLALRYFRGHGPATVHDLARWAGITVRDARAGLAAAEPELARIEVGEVVHHLAPEAPDLLAACRRQARGLFLLPGFDEFVLGYGDRGAILDPEFAGRIVPGGNGVFRPTVVHDGRVIGTWRATGRGTARTVAAEAFTAFPDVLPAAIDRAAAALP
jgi:Winged helix DNA-binding domain